MAKRIRRRNSRGSGFLLLIIFLALAVAGGFFYASGKDATKKNIEDGKSKLYDNLDELWKDLKI